MNETLSVRIVIGNIELPMRVKPEDEALLRQAGKLAQEKLRHFENNFGIQDRERLLTMALFDVVVEKIKSQEEIDNDKSKLSQELQELDFVLGQTLNP